MNGTRDLLLEIGVEELPSSFVEAALQALPSLAKKRFAALRLAHGEVRVLGTPRRLSLLVSGLATSQPDLSEDLLGPPVSAGYDKEGKPTKAAEAFARKLGIEVGAIEVKDTPKGKYLAGRRSEKGKPAAELLGPALAELSGEIPFRKSMRWSDGDATFGRPVRWLVALFGEEVLPFSFGGVTSDRISYGHRFLAPGGLTLTSPSAYEETLEKAHVLASTDRRRERMLERLHAAATEAGGALIEDEFLVGENLSLVEEPHVMAGRFEERFLGLPEEVILEVARGHQRYFGVRGADGRLMPRYLAVVNTALDPGNVLRGNDRVMRARLSDAQFFYDEDRKVGLTARGPKLEGIVFHVRLGTVAAKVSRIVRLVGALGELLSLPASVVATARRGAELAKHNLVSLMVGEFPELQGVMGRAYAVAQGESEAVADVVRDHYQPKGAADAVAPTVEAALVSVADKLDTMVGCFAVGLSPTGAADPYALRRACIGILRTLLARDWDLRVDSLVHAAYQGLVEQGLKLDLDQAACTAKVSDFVRDRLKNLLAEELPPDVVDAVLPVSAGRPLDVRARARALSTLDADLRARVGEVFKRVDHIAKEAPAGDPLPPSEVEKAPHAAETELDAAYRGLGGALTEAAAKGDYAAAFGLIGGLAPRLSDYFGNVFVMCEDQALKANRLRLLRAVRDACSGIAHFQLLRTKGIVEGG